MRKLFTFLFAVAVAGSAAAWWPFSPPDGTPNVDNRVEAIERFLSDPSGVTSGSRSQFRAPSFAATDPSGLSSFTGPVFLSTTVTAYGRIAGKDVLGCADVRAFGAVGDGTADDTAAIQAAIDSYGTYGGPVCLPAGRYKVTATINFKRGTSLYGANIGNSWPTGGVGVGTVTVIDASTTTNITILNLAANTFGNVLQGFTLWGPVANVGGSGIGISLVSTVNFRISDVFIYGFYKGLYLGSGAKNGTLSNIRTDQTWNVGLNIYNGQHIFIAGSLFANANTQSGSAGGTPSNIRIEGNSVNITISNPLTDECFNGASTIIIGQSTGVRILGGTIYYSGMSTGAGAGYGILLGNASTGYPSDVTIQDVIVQNFDGTRVPLGTINIPASAARVKLINVRTVPNGGGDITDLASDTTWVDVNGRYKFPSLPSASPGAGSKQLWYDAADSNRVKFAP